MRSPSKNHRVEWWWRFSPGSAETYAVAMIFVVIASLIRWGLGLISDDIMPLTTYYPAVLFAALVGRIGPGIFAAIAGGLIAWWAFMPPHFVFTATPGQQISLVTYAFACGLIAFDPRRTNR